MTRTLTTRILRRDEMRNDAPLSAAIESFFTAQYDLSPKTLAWYRMTLSAYVNWVRRTQEREPVIADVDKHLVDAFLKERISTPTRKYPQGSPFAARAAAVTLKRFGNWLAQDGILSDAHGASVLKHVKRTKVDDDVRQPLTDEELEAVKRAAGAPGERDYTLILFLAGTGLRSNEAREARIGDLSLAERTFTVRPETSKFGRSRIVYFHDAVARELDRYLRERPELPRDTPLFPSNRGDVFDRSGWDKVFQRIRGRSGVRHFSAHTLRHTWATNFMKQPGADLLQLKRFGGWQRWEMVERYAHAVPPSNRAALPNPVSTNAPLVSRPFRALARKSAFRPRLTA